MVEAMSLPVAETHLAAPPAPEPSFPRSHSQRSVQQSGVSASPNLAPHAKDGGRSVGCFLPPLLDRYGLGDVAKA